MYIKMCSISVMIFDIFSIDYDNNRKWLGDKASHIEKEGFDVRIGVQHFPLPVHGRPDRNILCVLDVFTRDMVRTSENGGAKVFPNGRCLTGGVQKVCFS